MGPVPADLVRHFYVEGCIGSGWLVFCTVARDADFPVSGVASSWNVWKRIAEAPDRAVDPAAKLRNWLRSRKTAFRTAKKRGHTEVSRSAARLRSARDVPLQQAGGAPHPSFSKTIGFRNRVLSEKETLKCPVRPQGSSFSKSATAFARGACEGRHRWLP